MRFEPITFLQASDTMLRNQWSTRKLKAMVEANIYQWFFTRELVWLYNIFIPEDAALVSLKTGDPLMSISCASFVFSISSCNYILQTQINIYTLVDPHAAMHNKNGIHNKCIFLCPLSLKRVRVYARYWVLGRIYA